MLPSLRLIGLRRTFVLRTPFRAAPFRLLSSVSNSNGDDAKDDSPDEVEEDEIVEEEDDPTEADDSRDESSTLFPDKNVDFQLEENQAQVNSSISELVEIRKKAPKDLVPSDEKPRKVICLLTDRPLLPGLTKILPQDPRTKLKKQGGYVAFFMRKKPLKVADSSPTSTPSSASSSTSTSRSPPSSTPSPNSTSTPPSTPPGTPPGAPSPPHTPDTPDTPPESSRRAPQISNRKKRIDSLKLPEPMDPDSIYQIGTLAWVEQHGLIAHDKNWPFIQFRALRTIQFESVSQGKDGVPYVNISYFEEPTSEATTQEEKAILHLVLQLLQQILRNKPPLVQQFEVQVNRSNIHELASFCSLLCDSATNEELQRLLSCFSVIDKLKTVHTMLQKELQFLTLQAEIRKNFEQDTAKNQKKMMYFEQYKFLKKELGFEKDAKALLIQKFKDRLEGLTIPLEVQTVIEEELAKMDSLEPQSSEFSVSRNYVDWLTSMPWGKYTETRFDIDAAEKILNEDHFGLQDVKDRVIEFVAISKLCGTVPPGKILCFVGPPGTGKTSVGTSIARALNREFFRFSVGGLSDVSEIKGHRRTYIGAMPGKLALSLKNTKSMNPVVLIDEIDKLVIHRAHGDPSAALLEVLDPAQNNAFMDHYMDVPIDLSKVLFVCTANTTETIPAALKDRMEFIRLSGYIASEKLEIARRYLQPQIVKESGMKDDQVTLHEETLMSLIKWYCREAGVRNLQQFLNKIYRKAAVKLVRGEEHVEVSNENITDFVGKRKFQSERLYEETPVGVGMGLAWNTMGGSVLYIESVVTGKKPQNSKDDELDIHFAPAHPLKATGQLGQVMTESTQIAQSFALGFLFEEVDPASTFFRDFTIHLHFPEGATPKDGPSAGSAIVTALLSLALKTPVLPNLAMTGEISLTGHIHAIGGVKEKTIGARRAGIKTIIFPKANRADWEELSDEIKEGFTVHFVSKYREVFKIAFPSVELQSERVDNHSSSPSSDSPSSERPSSATSSSHSSSSNHSFSSSRSPASPAQFPSGFSSDRVSSHADPLLPASLAHRTHSHSRNCANSVSEIHSDCFG